MNILMREEEMEENEEDATIIYVEENKKEWTYEATKALLRLFNKYLDFMKSGEKVTLRKMWEMICTDLAKEGIYYSPAQCENKWKSLKRGLISKKANGTKQPHRFEKEIQNILAKRPVTALCDIDFSSANSNSYSNDDDDSDSIPTKIPKIENSSDIILKEVVSLRKTMNKQQEEYKEQQTHFQESVMKSLSILAETAKQRLELETKRNNSQQQILEKLEIQNTLLKELSDKFE